MNTNIFLCAIVRDSFLYENLFRAAVCSTHTRTRPSRCDSWTRFYFRYTIRTRKHNKYERLWTQCNIRRWNESASKSQCHSHRVWHTFLCAYVHWHGFANCLNSIACSRMVCDGKSSGWDDECCIEKSEKSQNPFGICGRDDDYGGATVKQANINHNAWSLQIFAWHGSSEQNGNNHSTFHSACAHCI